MICQKSEALWTQLSKILQSLEGHYLGVVTEGDFLWTLKKRYDMNLKEAENVSILTVERRMEFRPVSINASMEDLIQTAMNQNFVPVIDDKKIQRMRQGLQ